MTDKEKVISGLMMLANRKNDDTCEGLKCLKIAKDAIALLKEQEALIHFLEHQREKGHWIFGETNGHGWMKCSQCCVSQDGQTSCYLFCPCCGADMTEGR